MKTAPVLSPDYQLDRAEAASLVGMYESMQKLRIMAGLKISSHQRFCDTLADPESLRNVWRKFTEAEKEAAKPLVDFAESQALGRWALQIHGVGHIVVAGLLAHIDIGRARTAGNIWSFAGLNPNQPKWQKGQIRPFNMRLKTICVGYLGESFKKASATKETMAMEDDEVEQLIIAMGEKKGTRRANLVRRKQDMMKDEAGLYLRVYREEKERLTAKNEAGEFAENAERHWDSRRKNGVDVSNLQRKAWEAGKLQPTGVDRMAMRVAVKLFLSHWHHVGSELLYGKAPEPWVIAFGNHGHYIPPPCWPMKE